MSYQNLISNCCGADSQGGEDYGICPSCLEHCEFENPDDAYEIMDNRSIETGNEDTPEDQQEWIKHKNDRHNF